MRALLILIGLALAACEGAPPIHNTCLDWNWQDCRTFVLQSGIFGNHRCRNPWHELVVEQGIPICRCKRRPECD